MTICLRIRLRIEFTIGLRMGLRIGLKIGLRIRFSKGFSIGFTQWSRNEKNGQKFSIFSSKQHDSNVFGLYCDKSPTLDIDYCPFL
jgi:hypothetical protein